MSFTQMGEGIDYVPKIPILSPTGVTAGSYTASDLTVDEYGRITSAQNGAYVGLPTQSAVETIYVSLGASASDSNDGLTAKSAKATIAAAITALAGPGIVQLLYGTFQVGGTGGNSLATTHAGTVIRGLDRALTTIQETVASQAIISLNADHCVIEDLTLDCQTNNAQECVSTANNYCGLRRCQVLGGSQIFAVYFAGPSGATQAAPTYNTGNFIEDLILTDAYPGDGLSWSFQSHSWVKDVIHTGSRISVYCCVDTLIENYHYTPGAAGIGGSRNGFYITPPSQRVTVRGFYGSFGTLGNGPVVGASSGYINAELVLDDVRVAGAGAGAQNNTLTLNDVSDAKLSSVVLESNASLILTATTTGGLDVTATGCTFPQVAVTTSSSSNPTKARLVGCKFPAFSAVTGQSTATFANINGVNGAALQVVGGEYDGSSLVYYFNNNGTSTSTATLRGVAGVNPYMNGYQPAYPASNVYVNNTSGVDQTVYLFGGTLSNVYVASGYGGTSAKGLGTVPGTVRVPAGGSVALTFSAAGSWLWMGE